jgi:hypothetical protein
MSIDIYSPRVMIAALEQMKPVRTVLRDNVLPDRRGRIAPRTSMSTSSRDAAWRRSSTEGAGKFVEREGFTTSSVTPPCVAPKTTDHHPGRATRLDGRERLRGSTIPRACSPRCCGDDSMTLDNTMLCASRGDDVPRRDLHVRQRDSTSRATGDHPDASPSPRLAAGRHAPGHEIAWDAASDPTSRADRRVASSCTPS